MHHFYQPYKPLRSTAYDVCKFMHLKAVRNKYFSPLSGTDVIQSQGFFLPETISYNSPIFRIKK